MRPLYLFVVVAAILVLAGCDGRGQFRQHDVPPRIIAFTASWCQPCHLNEPALAALERSGIPVTHVDIDRDPGTARGYHVTVVPTYILYDRWGRQIDRTQDIGELTRTVRILLESSR